MASKLSTPNHLPTFHSTVTPGSPQGKDRRSTNYSNTLKYQVYSKSNPPCGKLITFHPSLQNIEAVMSDSYNGLTAISMSLHIQQRPMTNTTTSSSFSSTHINPNSSHSRHRFRPKLGTCKSGGTNLVSRDDPHVEIQEGEETFDYDDARAMSPRRSNEDLEKMGQDTKEKLSQHAKNLQESFLKISDRLEAVKREHDKLDSNNKFLREYIADLSSTLRVPASGQVAGRSSRNPVM